jgi:hypothetical protein
MFLTVLVLHTPDIGGDVATRPGMFFALRRRRYLQVLSVRWLPQSNAGVQAMCSRPNLFLSPLRA